MKRIAFFLIVCIGMIANNSFAQQTSFSAATDSTGLPGDNFSLQGALEMFKQSKTPEEFEKKLNTENNYVNNLDLNDDGKTDYVRVIDKAGKDAHAIVLQVSVSKNESQDVAVITIEKQGKESAMLQIIGDAALYGDSTYVEPVEASGEKTKGAGPSGKISSIDFFFVNVWYWPCVTYMWEPVYVVYVSPWYWDYYPMWWYSWRPMPWYRHHHYCNDYYYGYQPTYYHNSPYADNLYYGHRRSSPTVENRYQYAHQQYQTNRMNTEHRGTYNNNAQSKGVNNNLGKPANNNQVKNNGYNGNPNTMNQTKYNNGYQNKPGQSKGNGYNSKPGNTYQQQPANTNQGRNDNSYQSKPGNNVQSKPGNNVQSKPNNTQSKPSNNVQSRPSNNQKVNHGSNGKTTKSGGNQMHNSNQGVKQGAGQSGGKRR